MSISGSGSSLAADLRGAPDEVLSVVENSNYDDSDVYASFMKGGAGSVSGASRTRGDPSKNLDDWVKSFGDTESFLDRGLIPPPDDGDATDTEDANAQLSRMTEDKLVDEINNRFSGFGIGEPDYVSFFTNPQQKSGAGAEKKKAAPEVDPFAASVPLDFEPVFDKSIPTKRNTKRPPSSSSSSGTTETLPKPEDESESAARETDSTGEDTFTADEEAKLEEIAREEFARDAASLSAMRPEEVAGMSDKQVGDGWMRRFLGRAKDAGILRIGGGIVYRWLMQNKWRIMRDIAIAVGGTIIMGYGGPLLSGAAGAGSFNPWTFLKEANTFGGMAAIAASVLKATGKPLMNAVFRTTRESLAGKDLLGSKLVQSTLEKLGVRESMRHLDAATAWDIAQVPMSVLLNPDMFNQIVLQPMGLWKPLLELTQEEKAKKWSLPAQFAIKTLVSGALTLGSRTKQANNVSTAIGSSIKWAATAPWRMMKAITTHPKLFELGSKVATLAMEGVKHGANYMETPEFMAQLEEAAELDAKDEVLQTNIRGIINDAVVAETKVMEAETDRVFEEHPVPPEFLAEASITPAVYMAASNSTPPAIVAAQQEATFTAATISTIAGIGTAVAGWVATSVALRLIGAPSVSEIADALPAEYTNFLARHTNSFVTNLSEHVNIETTAYTLVSNSIGIPGVIKKLAGRIPIPQMEALKALNAKISSLSAKATAENSNLIARTFMSIMLGTEVYTKKTLASKTLDELKEIWRQRGGKLTKGQIGISKDALIKAILKQQSDSAAALHEVLFEAVSAQALTSSGAAALGGVTKIAYSQASGIYTAILENDTLTSSANLDELGSRTLRAIMNDPAQYDPYGVFQHTATWSKDVAAMIADTKNEAMIRAYEAKRVFDEFLVSATKEWQPKDPPPPPQQQQQPQELSFPAQNLQQTTGDTADMFTSRTSLLNTIATTGGVPASMANWMLDMNRKTEQATDIDNLRKEVQNHTQRQASDYSTAFQTLSVDPKAFDAAKRLASKTLENTQDSLKQLLGVLPGGIAGEALRRALLSSLFGGATSEASHRVVTAPTSSNDKKVAPIDVKELEILKGMKIDPLSDVLFRRLTEAALDGGAESLLYFLKAKGTALFLANSLPTTFGGNILALAGLGASTVGLAGLAAGAAVAGYNQYSKHANKMIDLSQIVRAVALATTQLKDGKLAKLPDIKTRFREIGSVKELLEKSGIWEKIAEERKIDVYAVITREVLKFSTSYLTDKPQTKMDLFRNIAWELVGPLEPGVVELARTKTVDMLVQMFMAEESLLNSETTTENAT